MINIIMVWNQECFVITIVILSSSMIWLIKLSIIITFHPTISSLRKMIAEKINASIRYFDGHQGDTLSRKSNDVDTGSPVLNQSSGNGSFI